MSFREDYFRMLDGKGPVSDVPYYAMMAAPDPDNPSGMVMIMPERNDFISVAVNGKNSWGVPYKIDDFGTGFMPAPGEFMLTDITKWRDIVKAPYDYDYDWAAAAERDLALNKWDPETQVSNIFGAGGNYFLSMSGFMGFEGTMLAMYDEPEALHELLDYLCDYDIWVLENMLKHYKGIDVWGMGDDNATEINPFFSYEMFKEFFYPRYKRVADLIKSEGKVLSYHNCGRCEDFMDDMVDMGVQVWNCATEVNDLNAFSAKHDNKIILEFAPRMQFDGDEESIRSRVRMFLDEYANNGSLMWLVNSLTMNEELGANLMNWIADEVRSYGKGFYAK